MAEVRDFYYGLPLFTRYWLGLTLITTFLTKLWWVDYNSLLVLNFDAVFTHGQIWRPITALFYYPFNLGSWFHFITNCWVMYCYSETLENNEFRGRPADYLTLLVFNWVCCVLIGFLINVKYLLDAVAMSVLNVWCQHNRAKVVVFRIGFEFKAKHFPWWLLLFNIIINQGGVMELIGIIVGHVAYFLAFQYPEQGGPALLKAPSILSGSDDGVLEKTKELFNYYRHTCRKNAFLKHRLLKKIGDKEENFRNRTVVVERPKQKGLLYI